MKRPRSRSPRFCGFFVSWCGPEAKGEYYSINVRCLDGVDLSGVPVKYLDGLHDTWAELGEAVYVNPFGAAGGLV